MYREHFGLKELPFSIAPDPRYLYLSGQHREALAHLVYGITGDGGFVLLTGEVGTGKTTVCRCLLEQLPEGTDVAFLLNPKLTVDELLAAICDDLGIRYPEGNRSIKVFVDCINRYLLDAYSRGRKTVLIIEEAQNLAPEVLEQIRLLTNLETNQRKLLQIIMIGQPELGTLLSRSEMRQLAQRITARYHLGPLTREEVFAYVSHRLSVAGVSSELFSPSAVNRLYRLSSGIPRLINVICDRALLGAYAQGKDSVNRSTLTKAAREVLGELNGRRGRVGKLRWLFAGLVISAIVAVLTVALYGTRPQSAAMKATEKQKTTMGEAKTDAIRWSVELPVGQSKDMAYAALFGRWDIPYRPEENNPACRQAQGYGLRCLEGPASLSGLLQMNRPMVLKLRDDDGREFYAALTSVSGDAAALVVGTASRIAEIKEIAGRWLGEYTLLWRAPPYYQGEIKPGSRGRQVQWLDEQVARAQGLQARSLRNAVYDDRLVSQVKKFQLSEGLVPDGIVGSRTLIRLSTAVGDREPVLTARGGP
ncbi:MAG TPA: AAA family ATPase [Thermodesulfovibrionales bacterium]|nr:AAA family ATPase [Thermodesulfovibrionales bacterium]